MWAERPAEDAVNPALDAVKDHPWPLPLDPTALRRRRWAARTVLAYAEQEAARRPRGGRGR